MKITRIELNGYNQFKNVTIDLIYPEGHPKAGKPLDKVCFIGQCGTGKTSLLRIIKWFVSNDRTIGENILLPVPPKGSVRIFFEFFDLDYSLSNLHNELTYGLTSRNKEVVLNHQQWLGYLNMYRKHIKPQLINFPTELLHNRSETKDKNDDKTEYDGDKKGEDRAIIDFAFEDVTETWNYILKEIKEHRAKELFHKNQIAEIASQEDVSIKEIEEKTKEYKEWLAKNPNPLKTLAKECLDPILKPVGLKTKTDLDLKSILNLGFIELQTKDGVTVPRDFWSTGTKQLVQTAIPLYQLKPNNTIILIDEPERSIYPDIQRNVIDIYSSLAPECQFFYATHSPIIASAFEPWEIVELKFDETHTNVYREHHYEGKNHVDNYKYFPEYLRWDSILNRVFDIEEEGNKKRLKALEELAELNIRIRKLKEKNKLNAPEGQKLVDQFENLSKKLDWRIDTGTK